MKVMILLLLILAHSIVAQNPISLLQIPAKNRPIEINTTFSGAIIPLEIRNGMAFVKANRNGKAGYYLLDTGAPTLVLNQRGKGANVLNASGITGGFSVESTRVSHFQWGIVDLRQMEAIAADLNHFAQMAGLDIDGMIGYDVLKAYELFIDYPGRQLALLHPEKSRLWQAGSPLKIVTFDQQHHLPVIEVMIGGQKFYFGLDTGAAVNIMDQKHLSVLLPDNFAAGEREEVRGLDERVQWANTAIIHQTDVDGVLLSDMKYLFTDLSHLSAAAGLKIDGLLGLPFFEKAKYSINYPKRQLFIWDLRGESAPAELPLR